MARVPHEVELPDTAVARGPTPEDVAESDDVNRRLWAHVRAAAAADDSGDIAEITVNASPYALAIYRRWGFLPDGERREHEGLTDIPMRWTQAAQARRSDDFLPDVPPA